MKLTNYHRTAFVSAVMQDVPEEPYKEQAQKLFKNAMDQLWKDQYGAKNFELRKKLCEDEVFCTHWYHTPFSTMCYHGLPDDYDMFQKKCPDACAEIQRLFELHKAQCEIHNNLETKLKAVAAACTTRKALAEALPEFEKYLPSEAPKGASLPAVANVVEDFVQAGWPKGQTHGNELSTV